MGMIPGSFIIVDETQAPASDTNETASTKSDGESEYERLIREFRQWWDKLLKNITQAQFSRTEATEQGRTQLYLTVFELIQRIA